MIILSSESVEKGNVGEAGGSRIYKSPGFLVVCVAGVLVLALGGAAHAGTTPPALQAHLDAHGVQGSFLLYNAEGESLIRLNPDRASRRLIPASTFKIPNSLIALETGILADEKELLPWDGVRRHIPDWNRDHDLASAFAASTVWFYQEVARRIGLERMKTWVERIGYGNGEIGEAVDRFWLEGPLRISPEEQIGFLRRLHAGELPFSERSLRIVKGIMLAEQGEEYAVRAKTGWGTEKGVHHGWYVGWVERSGGPRFFALEVESPEKDFPMFRARAAILRGILSDLGLISAHAPAGSRL